MPPTWLRIVADAFIILSVLCGLVIVGDILAGRRQKMWIMNIVWPITALYFGPVGLWAYWTMGRPKAMASGQAMGEGHEGHKAHQPPDKPFWQKAFVGTCHCGAGCVFGDFIAEWALFLIGFTWFGSKLLTAFVVDFTLAYLFGIIFQYFTIAPMRNLGFGEGLVAAIKADTISLIAFEVGMFGFMALNQLVFFDTPPEPNTMVYWFLMQLAMIVGFLTSYPANWFLLRWGIKEAM